MDIIIHGVGKTGIQMLKTASASEKVGKIYTVDKKFINGGSGVYSSIKDIKEKADVIIDFSSPTAINDLLFYAETTKTPLLLATTGYSDEDVKNIYKTAEKIPVFLSGNLSDGIAYLINAVENAVKFFPDAEVEIVETHHRTKADSPSGTALLLAKAVTDITHGKTVTYGKRERGDVGVSSIRLGETVGEHEVIIHSKNQTILLKHVAEDKSLFTANALKIAEFLIGKSPAVYGLKDVFLC